jgi:hypothetical protein
MVLEHCAKGTFRRILAGVTIDNIGDRDMNGKKPSGFALVRGFRGQILYLASVHAGSGFRWVDKKDEALVFADAAEATRVSERAAREYGAKTTVVDMHETVHVVVASYKCQLCGQRIDDGKPCGCGARPVDSITGIAHVYNGAHKAVQS